MMLLRSVWTAMPPRGAGWPDLGLMSVSPLLLRDIAKNALLRWRLFIYWTFLGVFDALVFFFGAYFMFENTTVTINGQVSTERGLLLYCLVMSPTVCSRCVEQLSEHRAACGSVSSTR